MSVNEIRFRLAVDGGASVQGSLGAVEAGLGRVAAAAGKINTLPTGQVEGSLRGVEERVDKLSGALRRVGHYGAGLMVLPTVFDLSAGAAVRAADAVTTLHNQLKLATGGSIDAGRAYEALFDIAQRSRVSFTELGGTFASISRAGEALGLSQGRLLGVTEAIGNAVTISGGSAASAQAALMQLGQGLASGTLRGEELNSVMEQTPRLARALADGLGVSIGKLREMGAAGEITAEKVIAALESQSKVLNGEVAGAALTVGQAMTQLSNAATKAVGDFDATTGASAALARAVGSVAEAVAGMGATLRDNRELVNAVLGAGVGLAAAAGIASVAGSVGLVHTAVIALGAAMAANPLTLALLGIGAAVGAVVAASEAQKNTVKGLGFEIDHTGARIAQFEAQLKGLGGSQGGMTRGLEERIAALKQYRGELEKQRDALQAAAAAAQPEIKGAGGGRGEVNPQTVGQVARQQAEADAYLAEVRGKLSGVSKEYGETLTKLQALREAGLVDEAEYVRLVSDLAEKNHKAGQSNRARIDVGAQYLALVADLLGAERGLASNYNEQLTTLAKGYAATNRSAQATDTYRQAVEALIARQPFAVKAAKDAADADKAWADAVAGLAKAASGSADTVEARVTAMEDEERAALLAEGGMMNLAQAVEAVAIARLQDERAQALSVGDEERAAALQREITARERLIELSGRKEARDAVQRGGERRKSESERRLEGYLSKDIGTDLSAGFDKASQSLGQFVQQFVRLNDEQAEYLQAQRDAGTNTDKLAAVEARHAQAQISGYAAMAGAAKGMFAQNSAGYRAMAAAEKALRVAQLAGAISTAAKQIGLIGAVTTAKVGGDATMALSDTTRAGVEQSNSFLTAAAKGAEAVVNAIRSLPFPANLAAGAATAAAVAALGVRILGGGGGGGARASNTGTGTVLGDPQAQSQSIVNSTQRLEQVNTETMRYSAQMLDSLRSIEGNIGGLTALLVRSGGVQGLSDGLSYSGAGTLASIARGVTDVFTLGMLPALGSDVARIVGGKSNVTGEGVTFGAQTLGSVLASGQLSGGTFVNYREKKNVLDDWDNERKTGALDDSIEAQFGKVFASINTTLVSAADALGLGGESMRTALEAYVVQIGDINLKGLSAEEQSERISAVLSAESDRIVKAVLPEAIPLIDGFAQVGEGYLETFTRMATGSEQAGLALRRLGVDAVALSDIANQQADDVGAELVRDSLVAAETTTKTTTRALTELEKLFYSGLGGMASLGIPGFKAPTEITVVSEVVSGIGEIISTLDGSADDLASAYVSLINVRTAFGALGLAGSAVTRDLLAGAGGIDALADSLSAYEDGFATTSERLASQGAVMRDAFQRLGLAMPTTEDAFRDLVRGIDTSTASGQELLGQVLGLSGGLRELLDAVQATTSGITDEIERIRGLMSSSSTAGQSLAQLQASFAVQAAQAKAGDATALEGLPDASRALLDAAADMVGSRADLVRLQASTASTLQGVADAVNAAALEAASSSGAAVTTAPEVAAPAAQAVSDPALQDVLAELQSLRAAAQRQADQAAERDAQILELQQAVAAATAETARVLRDITPNGSTISVSLEAGGL